MSKEPPILVVNKPRRTSTRRRTTGTHTSSRTPKRKRKKTSAHRSKEMPEWLGKLILVLVGILVVGAFYWFYIRPNFYRWGHFEAARPTNIYFPAGYSIYGIDLSHHQGEIQWDVLRRELGKDSVRLRFIFHKATEGTDHLDKSYYENMNMSRRYGYINGAYHYFKSGSDPIKQAEWFIERAKLRSGDLAPVLDVEEESGYLNDFRHNVLAWLRHVEAYYGVKPIIYASHSFRTTYLNAPEFDAYPFWIAHYYVREVQYKGKWDFWQHTDRGVLPGITEDVDLNVFNGNESDITKLLIP